MLFATYILVTRRPDQYNLFQSERMFTIEETNRRLSMIRNIRRELSAFLYTESGYWDPVGRSYEQE